MVQKKVGDQKKGSSKIKLEKQFFFCGEMEKKKIITQGVIMVLKQF